VQFRVLGPVEIHADGREVPLTRRQLRCLLAILLLDPGRVVPAQRLCALMWNGEAPEVTLPRLRSQVARLRGVLARAGTADVALELAPGGYRLRVDPEAVDAQRFRRLVERAAATPDPLVRDAAPGDRTSTGRRAAPATARAQRGRVEGEAPRWLPAPARPARSTWAGT